jgi:hypothetical protein
MKLNNKGWGMMTFIIIIAMLLGVILLISFLVNNFDDELPSASRRVNINYIEINKNIGV